MKLLLASLFGLFVFNGLPGLTPGARLAAEPVDYVRDIKPILTQHCYACHGPLKQRSGLRLDTAAAILQGGNTGAAVVPGKSGESRIMKAVTGTDDVKLMPPKEPRLSAQQIARLKAWIDQGAKVPAGETTNVSAAKNNHWAFQTPVRPKEPAVKNAAWVRNPIDRFILARLEKEGITPSPETDRVTLIRRLSLDLLGLPPSLQEVDDFLADIRPDAYERLVDRLLESLHYGERWGRHWLDLARYADSHGFTIDGPRSIWKYRDWVIDAFNKDLPFDQFTIQQVAGDLLPPPVSPPSQGGDIGGLSQKIATGFHRNTLRNEEGGIDLEQFRVESVVDRVNTTGTVFLGLTIGCAQCHDHKFDPVSQREYYQLFAFLNNADEPILELPTPEQVQQRSRIRAELAAITKQLKNLDTTSAAKQEEWEKKLMPEDIARLPAEIQTILAVPENGRSPKQKQTLTAAYRKTDLTRHVVGGLGDPLSFLTAAHLQTATFRLTAEKRMAELKKSEPEIVTTLVMQERKAPRMTHVHLGGDFVRKGVQVTPGVPAVLHPLPSPSPPNRLDLARWLIDPKNPLTARVTMNRFWQHYFGLGIVETENDFGTQGTPPTHPDLLDWLATEFMRPGEERSGIRSQESGVRSQESGVSTHQPWSMKRMHRLIVASAAYRQSSRSRPELATIDPRNRLLARQSRFRLEAEVVRDVALASSGLLSCRVGGPSVYPPQPDGVYRFTQINRDWKPNTGPERYRRGLYTYFWRSAPHPGLMVFDAPDANFACTRRNRSNTPLQALTLLNDQAFFEFAQGLAARVLKEAKLNDVERLHHAFRLCVARTPSEQERTRLVRLLAELDANPKEVRLLGPAKPSSENNTQQLAAWTTVARVLLNLDEFITRE